MKTLRIVLLIIGFVLLIRVSVVQAQPEVPIHELIDENGCYLPNPGLGIFLAAQFDAAVNAPPSLLRGLLEEAERTDGLTVSSVAEGSEVPFGIKFVQIALPGQPADQPLNVFLFGDVEITVTPSALTTTITTTARGNPNLREGPSTNTAILGSAQDGQELILTGRNANATWFRARLPDGSSVWVNGDFVSRIAATPLEALPVVGEESGEAAPSFHVTVNGSNQTDCLNPSAVYFYAPNLDITLNETDVVAPANAVLIDFDANIWSFYGEAGARFDLGGSFLVPYVPDGTDANGAVLPVSDLSQAEQAQVNSTLSFICQIGQLANPPAANIVGNDCAQFGDLSQMNPELNSIVQSINQTVVEADEQAQDGISDPNDTGTFVPLDLQLSDEQVAFAEEQEFRLRFGYDLLDPWGDHYDRASAGTSTTAPENAPDLSSVVIVPLEDGMSAQVTVNLLPFTIPSNGFGAFFTMLSVVLEDGTQKNYLYVAQNGAPLAGQTGEVAGQDAAGQAQFVPGTANTVSGTPDNQQVTFTLPGWPQSFAVEVCTIPDCDKLGNSNPLDPATFTQVPPVLTPAEFNAQLQQIQSAETVAEQRYEVQNNTQCFPVDGSIPPDALVGLVEVRLVEASEGGKYLTVSIEPGLRAALDALHVPVRMWVNTYDQDASWENSYIVEYSEGRIGASAPYDMAGGITSGQQFTGSDGTLYLPVDEESVGIHLGLPSDAPADAPTFVPPTITDDMVNCVVL